jgi:hypothetical protein
MAYTLPVVYYLLVIVGIVLRVTHLLMIVLSGTAMAVKLGSAMSGTDMKADENIECTGEMPSSYLKQHFRVPVQLSRALVRKGESNEIARC